ncbi:hypothetical protein ANN_17127 [Periplaneta americana]|uniref:Reverse transcriptase domain-containing protein n=1 Tax=Periplaneta americana TaxID=6978 RepID=A0ABQ8SU61_PERAM|nr:hypothetical protein ANN_17127 [Periplaneta americana]
MSQNNMSNSATDTNSTKRQKLHHETTIPTSNAFAPLADLNERDQQESSYHIQMETSTPKKPPPIYIHNILNINSMLNELKTLDCGGFRHITIENNKVKLNMDLIDGYRKAIDYLKSHHAEFHTYQMKSEKAFRVVIMGLHHSCNIEFMMSELKELGYEPIQMLPVRHPITKLPLPLFFLDLKHNPKNPEIYSLTRLYNGIIKVEPPKPRKTIVQCMRCQQFGHTRNFCNQTARCVKCEGLHPTEKCNKPKDTPPICTNCKGNHPANYRGCPEHTRLQRGATRHQTIPYRSQPAPGTSSLDKTSASPPELKKVPAQDSPFSDVHREFSNRPLYSSISASSVNKQGTVDNTLIANNALFSDMIKKVDVLISLVQPLTKLAPNLNFFISGYKIYRADHPSGSRKGGSAVIIRADLCHNELPPILEDEVQISRVQIKIDNTDYQIGSFYSAPDQRVTPTLIWGIVHEMKFRFILGGDFNSKHPRWGSNVTNPRGIMLYDQIFKLNLEIAYPFEPTHYPDSGQMPDLLDFFIGKQFQHFCNVPRVIRELSSDHLPVLLTLSAAIPNSCVSQGSILAPFLYLIYTHDIPTPKSDSLTVAQFADDIAVLSKGDTGEQVTTILQNFLQEIEIWNKKWRTVMNTNKSSTVTFTYLKKEKVLPLYFNCSPVPQHEEIRYLGLILDSRLTWNKHLTYTLQRLRYRLHRLKAILSSSSLSLSNKRLIYVMLLKPIWLYGCSLWGSASISQIKRIQTFQNRALRIITGAPWYVRNETLHSDLDLAKIETVIHSSYTRLFATLSTHSNNLINQIPRNLPPARPDRRLKRKRHTDLLML